MFVLFVMKILLYDLSNSLYRYYYNNRNERKRPLNIHTNAPLDATGYFCHVLHLCA